MPSQTILTGDLSVAPSDQGMQLVIDGGGGHVYVIPLQGAAAVALGKALLAPSVVPAGNGHGIEPDIQTGLGGKAA